MIPPKGKDGRRWYGMCSYREGAAEDPARCAEEVGSAGHGWQCSRRRTHGELCRQHARRRADRAAERRWRQLGLPGEWPGWEAANRRRVDLIDRPTAFLTPSEAEELAKLQQIADLWVDTMEGDR